MDNGFIAHIEFNVQRGVSQAISVLAVATIVVKYTVFALRASDRQTDRRTDRRIAVLRIIPFERKTFWEVQ